MSQQEQDITNLKMHLRAPSSIHKHSSDILSLQKELKDKEHDLTIAYQTSLELIETNNELQQQLEEQNVTIQTLDANILDYEMKIDMLEAENQEYQQTILQTNDKYEQLLGELAVTREHLNNSNDEISEYQRTIQSLNHDIIYNKQTNNNNNNNNKYNNRNNNNSELIIAEYKDKLSKQQNKYDELLRECQKLREQSEQLIDSQIEIENMKKEQMKVEKRNKLLSDKIAELTYNNVQLEKEINDYTLDINEQNETIKYLNTENQNLMAKKLITENKTVINQISEPKKLTTTEKTRSDTTLSTSVNNKENIDLKRTLLIKLRDNFSDNSKLVMFANTIDDKKSQNTSLDELNELNENNEYDYNINKYENENEINDNRSINSFEEEENNLFTMVQNYDNNDYKLSVSPKGSKDEEKKKLKNEINDINTKYHNYKKETQEEIDKLHKEIASMQKKVDENESKNEETEIKVEYVQGINRQDERQRQISKDEENEVKEIELQEKTNERKEKIKQQKEKDHLEKAKKMITHQMQIFKDEANKIKIATMDLKYLPLHRFTWKDIANAIKCWKYNDIEYNKYLKKTINIFVQRDLNGNKIRELNADDMKVMVDNDLETFLSKDTIRIMFNEFVEWRKRNQTERLSSVDIGYAIYHLPLNKLLRKIHDEKINGEKFVIECQTSIEMETAWNKEDIYQLKAQLFVNHSYQKHEFIENMQKHMQEIFLSVTTIKSIQDTILKFENDLESIHLNIRYGKRNDEFNDVIINMVDDLVEQNNHDIKENDDIDGIFVSKIYKLISSCFMWNDYKIETHINEPLFRKYQWNCYNCGNVNFCAFVDSKINTDLGKCNLCGMTQKDAIMCNLRNYNTFVMETNYIETKNDSYISDEKVDEIDKNIKHVITSFGLDLICLNQNNNNPCKSIIRLAKCLIQHKEWVDRTHINVDHVKKIYKTINIDIKKHTNNDTYQDVIIECLKSFEKISNEQSKLFREHFGKMEVFFKICNSKKLFTKCVKEQTHIKPAVAIKLFNQIKASLMVKAHKKQFGTFFMNLKIDDIENDYNHILKHHIYGGSDETKKTVFVFFQNVVHYTDKTTKKNACKSYKRHQLVAQENKLNKSNSTNESQEPKNKDVWTCTSKQYYIQKQLDVMHSYLAHSDLKRMMGDYKNTDNITFNTDKLQDKDKYISYSFGIGHEYPHLSPLRDSIRDELSYNSVIPLGDKQFQDLLIKAINKHKYELKDYQDTLFCKYFNPEYNILRNEPIGIRHILALVVYTDLTQFCTVLRGTYRPKDDNEDEIGVTERHRQFYWYSRTLYESVEFFGQEMKETLKVFHGLKGSFQFDQFAAFFNQPVSTSKTRTVAQLFAGGCGGTGIILTLTSRSKNINDLSKVPKYLSVSWLSDHSHGEELLYYGSHVSFKIENITEIDNKNRSHQTELSIFNKFQSTLQNEYVKWPWNKNEISNLVKLIQHKIHNTEEKALFNTTCITDYGIDLFHNFCVKMTHISIKNFSYKKIPKEIFNVLFDDIQRVSFINLVKLFPNLEELCFNDLVLSSFVRQSKQYVEAVLDLLNYLKQKDSNDIALHKIQFESVKPIDNKKITTLQKLAYKSLSKLKLQRSEWRIKYRLQETHKLIFRDYQIIRINDIKDCNQKQMIYLVQQICNESDKLWPHKQLFVSYFKQNKIDGTQFVNSGRVEFVECMVNANSNQNKNKMSKQISKLLVKGLKTINETLPSIKEEFVEVNEDFSDVENALKEEQDKSVVLETTIYDLRKKIEELERQNQKPLNEQSMVASDTWYKRQIDMDDIDEGDIVNEIKEASTNNSCGCIISFFDKFKINKSKRSKNQSQIQFNLLDEQ